MSWKTDGHPTETEALKGTVEHLTRQLIERDLADMYRKQAEAEAAKPKPEPFELRDAKQTVEREFRDHSETYRQGAWLDAKPWLRGDVPLAAGWPPGVDPITYVRRFWKLSDDGTSLLGQTEPTPVTPAPSFMDQWRK